MRRFIAVTLFLSLGLISQVSAQTTVIGILEVGDTVWANPSGSSATGHLLDCYRVTVDMDGDYGFLSVYTDGLDGTLGLFSDPLDPAAPTTPLEDDDDYSDGDAALLGAIDDACSGTNCSGFQTTLTAGSYIVAQSSFDDEPSTFGSNVGAYEMSVVGPAGAGITLEAVTHIPEPMGAFLALMGFLGVAAAIRR